MSTEEVKDKVAEATTAADATLEKVSSEPVTADETTTAVEPTTEKSVPSIVETEAEAEVEPKPPARPARPLSPVSTAIKNLHEAFPTIEDKYIKMALIASEGRLDPAFNALLFLSDPTSDIPIPKPEAKPTLPSRESFARRKQLESDEALAKRLAREYERKASLSSATSSESTRQHRQPPPKPTRKPQWANDDDSDTEDFVETIGKSVEDAGNKIGGWFGNIAKKIQSEVNNNPQKNQLFSAFGSNNNESKQQQQQQQQRSNFRPNYNRRQSYETDNSSSGIGGIQLHDETEQDIYGTPKRDSFDRKKNLPETPGATKPAASSTSTSTSTAAAATSISEPSTTTDKSADSKGKWEPLNSVAAEPINDDTFLVDDSEDEDDSATATPSKEKK
ncbi:hypothetical protein CANARDRAFT_28311 [[Candida] arabinofermentans NRRL YB-2248]|uniref:CUE domain-containing protein n=1 Tax=[Candida] arabinofermentans NRRL YB-2248 TaxID=983967 RepID=A0A1E4T194_9ASCO|nr:hypothetical protein CANARDRAFT_28311 [[Candida] arabinofermentans NRRL YB-2248]